MNYIRSNPIYSVALLVFVLVAITRLPFISNGFGGDPDAWRVWQAAENFAATWHYSPSRPPGYPLPEMTLGLLVKLGMARPEYLVGLTSILSGIAAALFYTLSKSLSDRGALTATFALAFTPTYFVASLNLMDYMWGLCAFLGSCLCMLRKHPYFSAALLGLAVACRATYAFCVIPLVLMLSWGNTPNRSTVIMAAKYCATSGLIGALFYLPLVSELGERLIKIPPSAIDVSRIVKNVTVGAFGIGGVFAVAMVGFVILLKRNIKSKKPLILSIPLALIYGVLFLRLPDESAYLLPAIVGFYLFAFPNIPKSIGYIAVLLLAASSLFGSVTKNGGGYAFIWDGPVFRDSEIQDRRDCLAEITRQHLTEPGSYVAAGPDMPQIEVRLGKELSDRVLYAVRQESGKLIDEEKGLIENATAIYALDSAADFQSLALPLIDTRLCDQAE